jgi:hypothetical protein
MAKDPKDIWKTKDRWGRGRWNILHGLRPGHQRTSPSMAYCVRLIPGWPCLGRGPRVVPTAAHSIEIDLTSLYSHVTHILCSRRASAGPCWDRPHSRIGVSSLSWDMTQLSDSSYRGQAEGGCV